MAVPDVGDLAWLNFDPQVGHEQAGHRPALVLSPASYNGPSGLALVCPITTRVKGYPFELALPAGLPFAGVVLVDQVRSFDWQGRDLKVVGEVPPAFLKAVSRKLARLLPDQS